MTSHLPSERYRHLSYAGEEVMVRFELTSYRLGDGRSDFR